MTLSDIFIWIDVKTSGPFERWYIGMLCLPREDLVEHADLSLQTLQACKPGLSGYCSSDSSTTQFYSYIPSPPGWLEEDIHEQGWLDKEAGTTYLRNIRMNSACPRRVCVVCDAFLAFKRCCEARHGHGLVAQLSMICLTCVHNFERDNIILCRDYSIQFSTCHGIHGIWLTTFNNYYKVTDVVPLSINSVTDVVLKAMWRCKVQHNPSLTWQPSPF